MKWRMCQDTNFDSMEGVLSSSLRSGVNYSTHFFLLGISQHSWYTLFNVMEKGWTQHLSELA